jgi:cellulose synthase/poly-beta-1,6-N-acetylglucosamine synthase-like glycosyltransferase
MTSVLLVMAALLTGVLAVYAVGHYAAVVLFLLPRRTDWRLDGTPGDAVTIAIPARNEGEGAVRVIRSLIAQDHAGPLVIALLVGDRHDTAIPALAAAYPSARFDGEQVELQGGDRRVVVCFTGRDPKHDKVNWMASRLGTPYVAILDADHEAHPTWIRTSVALLQQKGGRIIQGRREPLSARGLFGLWDSLHQHIGCEVRNVAYRRLGLTVFFTGTTAVMDAGLLRDNPLRDCLTEDTDLSWRLVLAGETILYNPYSGSREEVSPDLYSFLARRRRWAHGHTEVFFRYVPAMRRLRRRQAAQLVFHGAHYLVAIAVFAVHVTLGLLVVAALPAPAPVAAAAVGAILAWGLVRTQQTRGWATRIAVSVVLFAWMAPIGAFAMALMLAVATGDLHRATLPLPAGILALGVVGWAGPLVVLLAGMAGLGQLGVGSGLAVALTWPLALVLDVAGVLIGLVDLVSRHRIWHAVARAPTPLAAGAGIRDSWHPLAVWASARDSLRTDRASVMKPSRWVPAVLLVAVVAIGVSLALPGRAIPASGRPCAVLEADGHPWIVPAAELVGYCDAAGGGSGHRTGSYAAAVADSAFTAWRRGDATFPCNEAGFAPDHVVVGDAGARLILDGTARGDRAMSAGELVLDEPRAFGRYEVQFRPAKASGVLSAMFLYRFDPWQEIDLEIPGKDTTKALLNVYYNPGKEGDLYNYGYRGTPVMVDLGFDAADAVHTYAIEWDPDEIRWFVDGELIHARSSGRPTPIPQLPMTFHVNVWPNCSEELVGEMDPTKLPVEAEVRSVAIGAWNAPYGGWFGGPGGDWRKHADWMKN